jgi:carbonic anhydrase/acetyltransferase-like protein (isoleucine patch superfamily)
MNLFNKAPQLGRDVFVADNAVVMGNVTLGDKASVFYGAVLRGKSSAGPAPRCKPWRRSLYPIFPFTGDSGKITVGEATNLQDGTVVTTGASTLEGHAADTHIGARVTVGHQAALHGCTIEDEALIGMGATLMQGSKVERGSMVAAGAVVAPGTVVPASEIWGGNPARHLRSLKPEESKFLTESAAHYVNVSAEHLKNQSLSLLDIAKAKGLA